MGALRQADLRAALELVGELGDVDDGTSFRVGLVAGVRRLIGADAVAYNQIDVRAGEAVALVDPPAMIFPESEQALARYGTQNPLVAHAGREPHHPALKISDFIGRRAFARTDIYDCLFAPAGLNYQMACGLRSAPGLVVGVSLNRASRDFCERDRALLDLLRPHLVRADERVAARELGHTAMTALETGFGGAARAAIVLGPADAIEFAGERARGLLEQYFASPADDETLPEPLAAWRRLHRQTHGEGALPARERPFRTGHGTGQLTARAIRLPGADHDVLILEEGPGESGGDLGELGLTARQAEILRLIADGRSDCEIAALLAITEHTVGKHLEHIFARLGVGTRTAAAAAAWRSTG